MYSFACAFQTKKASFVSPLCGWLWSWVLGPGPGLIYLWLTCVFVCLIRDAVPHPCPWTLNLESWILNLERIDKINSKRGQKFLRLQYILSHVGMLLSLRASLSSVLRISDISLVTSHYSKLGQLTIFLVTKKCSVAGTPRRPAPVAQWYPQAFCILHTTNLDLVTWLFGDSFQIWKKK